MEFVNTSMCDLNTKKKKTFNNWSDIWSSARWNLDLDVHTMLATTLFFMWNTKKGPWINIAYVHHIAKQWVGIVITLSSYSSAIYYLLSIMVAVVLEERNKVNPSYYKFKFCF